MLRSPHLLLSGSSRIRSYVAVKFKLFYFTSDPRECLFLQWELWTDDQTCLHQTEFQDYIFQGKHINPMDTHTHTNMHVHFFPSSTFAYLTVKTQFNLITPIRLSVQVEFACATYATYANRWSNIYQLPLLTGCFVNTLTYPQEKRMFVPLVSCWHLDDWKVC